MTTVIGPYSYGGIALTDTETAMTLSQYIASGDTCYIKLFLEDTQQTVYFDLNKIATFDRNWTTYQSMGVVAFLNTWYVPSSNQQGLQNTYCDPTYKDISDATKYGMIYAFNPVADSKLTVSPVSISAPDRTGSTYQGEAKSDLVISGDRDLSNVLTFLNGVFHNSIYWNSSQYIIDGMYSFRQKQKFDIQCYDTTAVGGHTVVPMTRDMCVWDADQAGILLTLPAGYSFTGKTAFLVIDGYLYHPGEILSVASGTKAFIHTNRIPFISQWRHNPLTKRKDDIVGENWMWGSPAFPDTQTPPVQTGSYRSINQQPDLDLFLNTRFVPMSSLTTKDFQFNRVTSPHSAVILINKPTLNHSVVTPYPIQVVGRYGLPTEVFPQGISRFGCGLSPSYVTMTSSAGQTWIHLQQQDYDMDRQKNILSPDCVTSEYPELERSISLPFSIHVFS